MRKMRQLLKPSKKVDQIEELRKIAKLSGVKLPHQRKKDAPKVCYQNDQNYECIQLKLISHIPG